MYVCVCVCVFVCVCLICWPRLTYKTGDEDDCVESDQHASHVASVKEEGFSVLTLRTHPVCVVREKSDIAGGGRGRWVQESGGGIGRQVRDEVPHTICGGAGGSGDGGVGCGGGD